MSAGIKSSNEYSEPGRSMGREMEFRRSSSHRKSANAVKQKFPEKCVVLNPFGQPTSDHQRAGLRRQIDNEHVMQQKSPVTRQMHQQLALKRSKDDELVKHMSNLPAYLQQAEKQKNIQVKALNFGVLDWNRLEKWKYNEHMPSRGHRKASSNGCSLDMENKSSTPSKTRLGRTLPAADLHLKSSEVRLPEKVQQSQGKFKLIQDPQTDSGSTISVHQNDLCQKVKSSSRICPRIYHDRGKKHEADQTTISQEEALSLEHTVLMSAHPMGHQNGKTRKTGDNDITDSPKYSNSEPKNIVLLMPKCPSKKSSLQSSWSLESRTTSNRQLAKDARNRYSDCFSSKELEPGQICNEVPHSCQNDNSIKPQSSEVKFSKAEVCNVDSGPLSAGSSKRMGFNTAEQTEFRTSSPGQVANSNWIRHADSFSSQELHYGEFEFEMPHSCPLPASMDISQGKGLDVYSYPFQSETSTEPRFSGATCSEARSCNLDDLVSVESFKRMDLDLNKPIASKGRHPSLSRRFSFSLGRLTRSFSFKESSTAPQFSSTSAAAKSSAAIDDTKSDRAGASDRRGPSPFRRLLDPLLKTKGANYTEAVQSKGAHPAEIFHISQKNSSFVNFQPTNTKPLLKETNEGSTFQALTELTIKNGLPFFKFVVDNSSDILVAALKQVPPTGKVDSTLTFSFYSVHEIKKKAGGWKHNGSKEKNCGFSYNIVGQMKTSRSFHSSPDDFLNQSTVTESVLFDINIAEGDKETAEVSPNSEIAAIIFKEPAVTCNDGEPKADNAHTQKGSIGSSPGSTTVILPGGFHSSPNNGAPSSLIYRWKSGGSCDCGGWDVGCKLKILANHNIGSNISKPAMSCSELEHMNLFIQGGEGKSQTIFSLAPFKDGLYSVEFNASISLLEAFSICVAVITSRELSDIFDCSHLPDAKFSAEAKSVNDVDKKNTVTIQDEVPAKYVPAPPSSPVGRI